MIVHKITCYRYCLSLCAGGERQGLLFALESDDSQTGWGEAAPLPGFSFETVEDIVGASLHFATVIGGCSLSEAREQMAGGAITSPSLYFAFDSALRQIETAAHDGSSDTVALCALVTGDLHGADAQVENVLQAGYRTIKVKVGAGAVEQDIRAVKNLLQDFAGACCWRFDANRAWDYETGLRFCDAIVRDDVAYIEEPLQSSELLPQLHEQTGVPCAVDETLQELSACLFSNGPDSSAEREAMLRHTVENVQVLVWKPSLCMNPQRMNLDTAAPVVLSSAYESGVGTAAILEHAIWDSNNYAAGIDTYSRLEQDVLHQRLPLFVGTASMREVRTTSYAVNVEKLEEVWHV